MIEQLIARVFAARDSAHLQHWATTSYAEHNALGEFYDAIVVAIDAIVENYQGTMGQVDTTPRLPLFTGSGFEHFLQEESDWIESHRDEIASGSSAVANLIDTLAAHYNKAVFLLRLK